MYTDIDCIECWKCDYTVLKGHFFLDICFFWCIPNTPYPSFGKKIKYFDGKLLKISISIVQILNTIKSKILSLVQMFSSYKRFLPPDLKRSFYKIYLIRELF